MSATPALSVSGLTVAFGGIVAVNNVTLDLPVGARSALIGPNGAGKTTFVNLLTGTLKPTAGTIRIGDKDVTRLDTRARTKLGLTRTFQINTLFPHLTPLESVSLAIAEREDKGGIWWRRLGGFGAIRDEAEALLTQLRLIEHARTPTNELAYGKQRLLEIALALAAKPRILLLDEPAAGIPAGESREVFEVVDALPDDISVLFIEHDMQLVFRFARRIVVLTSGAILTEGTPDEIRANEEVRAAYLGGAHV
ncbi:ABC transporter ATP-binding protein [Amorphus orientalis]|uniref:Branched-chain amino acid transport system ATP-binding protein n=1 Tax=Amorphus orientalis TaxID=649198 RepID=A0AAE4AT69_9HYPH|nr:ABC transporter ATP-binding protein [Amorphus orientalis]MDQ0314714.1 branched-chain amino acid transport system ATP-binding protein [Amorphus orientalis]